MLPPKLQALLQSELKPFERVLWDGQPRFGRMLRINIPAAIFSLIFAGGMAYLPCKEILKGNIPWEMLPLLFFALLGLFFSFYAAGQIITTPKIIYTITSNRAVIITPHLFGGFDVRSLKPQIMTDISRIQSKDGGGDLIITHDISTSTPKGSNIPRIHRTPVGFFGISDVANVERILLAMRDENLRATTPNS